MAALVNAFSDSWLQIFSITFLQNSIFLLLIFLLLYLFRRQNPKLLKGLSLIGLLKFAIPPVLPAFGFTGFLNQQNLSLPEIIVHPGLLPVSASSLTNSSLLFLLWFIPAFLFLIRFVWQHFYLKLKFRRLQVIDSPLLPAIPDNIRIYASQSQHSPFVFGLFQPKIVLPVNWKSWSKTDFDIVIQHEISHIKQGDVWLNFLSMIVLSLHFYNPLVWILIKKISFYSEIICDNSAISTNRLNRKNYSERLLELASQTSNLQAVPSTLSFSKTHQMIKQRILYQLKEKEKAIMKKLSTVHLIILTAVAILIIPFSMDIQAAEVMGAGFTSADSTFEFFSVEQKPVILHKGAPYYPEIARKAGVEGTVVIDILIDENGDVEKAEIFKSVPELDEAAREAALKCKFKPAKNNGKAVKVKMKVPFKFKLQ